MLGGLKYALQTAIEALVDLAYHLCAKLYMHAPADARDALVVLAQQGAIRRATLTPISPWSVSATA